jgi:hypothetical protein
MAACRAASSRTADLGGDRSGSPESALYLHLILGERLHKQHERRISTTPDLLLFDEAKADRMGTVIVPT